RRRGDRPPRDGAVHDRRSADGRRRLDRPMKRLGRRLGIDVGATNVKLALLEDERVEATAQTPTLSEQGGPAAVLERVATLARSPSPPAARRSRTWSRRHARATTTRSPRSRAPASWSERRSRT